MDSELPPHDLGDSWEINLCLFPLSKLYIKNIYIFSLCATEIIFIFSLIHKIISKIIQKFQHIGKGICILWSPFHILNCDVQS